jgi:PIN domain nuclease of toxin-antitoxin system
VIVLDTHVLIWLDEGNTRLGEISRQSIQDAYKGDQVAVSAISFWEVAMLVEKGRLRVEADLAAWKDELLDMGLRELPVTGAVGILAAQLPAFHGDPADRLIAATALAHAATLVTADERLLGWSGPIQREDARR